MPLELYMSAKIQYISYLKKTLFYYCITGRQAASPLKYEMFITEMPSSHPQLRK